MLPLDELDFSDDSSSDEEQWNAAKLQANVFLATTSSTADPPVSPSDSPMSPLLVNANKNEERYVMPNGLKREVESLLDRYKDLFEPTDVYEVADTKYQHKMNTEGSLPVKQPPHRVSPQTRTIIKDHVEVMLERA